MFIKKKYIILAALILIIVACAIIFFARNFPQISYNIQVSHVTQTPSVSKQSSRLLPTQSQSGSASAKLDADTQDELSTLFEMSRSNTESANLWISLTIGVAVLIFTIILIILAVFGYLAWDKFRAADTMYADATAKALEAEAAIQKANQQATATVSDQPSSDQNANQAQETRTDSGSHSAESSRTVTTVDATVNQDYYQWWNFERIYRSLFDGQLQLLRMLRSLPGNSAANEVVNLLYNSSNAKNYLPYPTFIRFLVNSQLIQSSEAGIVTLTSLGVQFLEYLISKNIPLIKPF